VSFPVRVGNEGPGHAHGIILRAYLGDDSEPIFSSTPFELNSGVAHGVHVRVPRPNLADLIPACNNEPTLYSKPLRAELVYRGARLVGASYPDHGGGITSTGNRTTIPRLTPADPRRSLNTR
jgi:hypothetical protein